jgi:hypothetical protein
MVSPYERFRVPVLALLITVIIAGSFPAVAQQQDPPNTPSAPDSNSASPNDVKNGQAANQADKDAGKSKLEQQTGTANDRIFEVLPNYGTVRTNKTLPPLTVGQMFRLATAGAFDWAVWPFNGALAAIAQAKNDPDAWGQGWGAHGKRYGASFADNTIGTLHDDRHLSEPSA